MKATLAVLAVLGLTGAVFVNSLPTNFENDRTKSLEEDMNDFMKLIPVQKINDLFVEYLATDEEFQEAMDYVLSQEFKQFVLEIESMPEVTELLTYLQNAGLNVNQFIDKINTFLGIKKNKTNKMFFNGQKITGGLSGFFKDVKALIPMDKMKKLYKEKLETSKDFAALVKKLSSPEFQNLVDKIMAKPKFQEILHRLKSKGVNVQEVFDLFTSMFGLKFPNVESTFYQNKSLKDDFKDFMDLIPHEEIHNLFLEYLATDEDFQEAMEYIMSKEFKQFIMEIEAMSEVKDILNYLQNAGLEAYEFVNKINGFLGIPEIKPHRMFFNDLKITGGLNGFFKDVKALIPMAELEKLFKEKLETSKDFAAFIKKLRSPEFKNLIEKIMAKPKFQEIIKKLKSKGINVQEIFDILSSIFGFQFPKPKFAFEQTKSLKDDIQDFMDLIPFTKMQDLFYEYMAIDEEFQEALDYVMSKEFKQFIIEIESMSEIRDLLHYLEKAGIDVYGFINHINHYLNIPKILSYFKENEITGGLSGFFKDIKALIPEEKLKALFEEKLKTSKDFAAFIEKLRSSEFQSLVNKIMAKPKLQEVIQRLKNKGVNVQEVFDLLTSMLGLKFPSQSAMRR